MTATSAAQNAKDDARDLFLSYNSRDRADVLRVRQLLQLNNISTFLDRDNLHPGRPWFDELDAALRNVSGVAVFFGANGLGAIQKREMWVALDRQAQAEKSNQIFSVVPVILPGAKLDEAPGFLLLNTFIDLREPSGEAEALAALVKAIRGDTTLPATAEPAAQALCPYRGLRAFREEDSPLFFGREAFSRQLFEKTRESPFVAVVGASGSGKSSVVQAGLLPLLRRERPPRPLWEVATFTPGNKPFHNLAAGLLAGSKESAVVETDQLGEIVRLAEGLKDGSVPLVQAVTFNLKKSSAERLLLIVDQFEELFTLAEEPERAAFVRTLLGALEQAPLTILMTLRGDFFGEACGLSRQLSDRIQQCLVNIGPMTSDEVRQAVEQPARYAGLSLEPGLADRLIESIQEQPGSLPLLEFALSELWERRAGATLTHEAFESIGGIEGALSRRAEAQFAELSEPQRKSALRLFSRLVRVAAVAEDGPDTRQRVNFAELDEETQTVARRFVKARLLTASLNPVTEEETLEVAHEAILRRWDRLKQALQADREFLLWRQRLGFQVDEWHRTGRDTGALLRGASLREARRWQPSRSAELNNAERELLSASEKEAGRPKRWMVAMAAFGLLAALGGFTYSQWTRTNGYIQAAAATEGKSIEASASAPVTRAWLQALVRAGKTEPALEQAAKLSEPEDQALALAAIAETLFQTGQGELAQKTMNRALAFDQVRGVAISLAAPLSRLGRSGEALSILRKTEPSFEQQFGEADYDVPQPYAAALQAVAEAGQIDDALRIAKGMPEPYNQMPAFGAIIPSLVKAGRTQEALDLAKLFTDGSAGEYVQYYRSTIYAYVSLAAAELGNSEFATSAAMLALDEARRIGVSDGTESSAYAYVAIALAEAGKIAEADSIRDEIGLSKYIDRPQAAIAAALAKAGRVQEAAARLSQVGSELVQYRLQAWSSAAQRLGADQLGKEASSLAANPGERVSLLTAGSSWFADQVQRSEAEQLLKQAQSVVTEIADDEAKSKACGQVAEGWARTGSLYRSWTAAGECSQSDDKLKAYTAILLYGTNSNKR